MLRICKLDKISFPELKCRADVLNTYIVEILPGQSQLKPVKLVNSKDHVTLKTVSRAGQSIWKGFPALAGILLAQNPSLTETDININHPSELYSSRKEASYS